jgi:hypothetical protein
MKDIIERLEDAAEEEEEQDETEGHDMQKIKDRYRSLREAGLIHPEKEVQDVHRT